MGSALRFNISQVKRYPKPLDITRSIFSDIQRSLEDFSPKEDDAYDTHLTEIFDTGDPRETSSEMTRSKRYEIKVLLQRGTFLFIRRDDKTRDGNVLPGIFVLDTMSTEDNKIKFKVKYVIGGHRYRMKLYIVHSATTLQPTSIRLLF